MPSTPGQRDTMHIDDDLDIRIGTRIRTERESRGWSVSELAERSSVSRAMIFKVERKVESSPTANLLGKLSGAFGLSMSTLLAPCRDQPRAFAPKIGPARVDRPRRLGTFVATCRHALIYRWTSSASPAGRQRSAHAGRRLCFLRHLVWVLKGELVFVEGQERHEMKERRLPRTRSTRRLRIHKPEATKHASIWLRF